MSKKNHIPDDEQCQSCALKFAYDEISILYEIAVMLTNATDTKECIEKHASS